MEKLYGMMVTEMTGQVKILLDGVFSGIPDDIDIKDKCVIYHPKKVMLVELTPVKTYRLELTELKTIEENQ